MTSINAYTDALFILNPFYYEPDLFEGMSKVGPLASRIFNNCRDSPGFFKGNIDWFGYPCKAGFNSDLIKMTSGVKIEPVEAQ